MRTRNSLSSVEQRRMVRPRPWWAVLVCAALAAPVWAEQPKPVTYRSVGNSQVSIEGTSTMHDWTVNSNLIRGDAVFAGQWKGAPGESVNLQSVELVVPTGSLKSTEGSGMDKKVHETLNEKKYPQITYRLDSAKLISHTNDEYQYETTGELTVAGTTKPISLELNVRHQSNGDVIIETKTGFKMTDFHVKPPTAMLGMIRAGDMINIKASWQLTPEKTNGG